MVTSPTATGRWPRRHERGWFRTKALAAERSKEVLDSSARHDPKEVLDLPSGPSGVLMYRWWMNCEALNLGVVMVLVLGFTGHNLAAALGNRWDLSFGAVGLGALAASAPLTLSLTVALGYVVSFYGFQRFVLWLRCRKNAGRRWKLDEFDERWRAKFDKKKESEDRAFASDERAERMLEAAFVFGSKFGGVRRWANVIVATLVTMTVAAAVEEFLFRGCLQTGLVALLHAIVPVKVPKLVATTAAIVGTSFVFAAIHTDDYDHDFIFSVYLGIIFALTENLVVPIAAHAINNVIAVTVPYVAVGRLDDDKRKDLAERAWLTWRLKEARGKFDAGNHTEGNRLVDQYTRKNTTRSRGLFGLAILLCILFTLPS